MFITDTNGEKSITATVFLVSSIICNVKLILSGVEFYGFKFSVFSGSDYAMALGAAGAIYSMRRSSLLNTKKSSGRE